MLKLWILITSVALAAPSTHMARARKLCADSSLPAYLKTDGPALLVFCKECIGMCKSPPAKVPEPTNIDLGSEQITSVLFQAKPGAEEVDVIREHPVEMMRLTGANGLQLHHQISMKTGAVFSFNDLLVGSLVGPQQGFKILPLVEYSVGCGGKQCTYSPPSCRLTLDQVSSPMDRKRAREMSQWSDDKGDTLYLIDRVALMAAAGDEEMYALLAGKFRLMGRGSKDEGSLEVFQNATASDLGKVETLRELGCGTIKATPESDAAWKAASEKLAVLAPYREGGSFAGFEIKHTVKNDFFERNGMKVGDIIQGTDKVAYTDIARSADGLRDIPRIYSNGGIALTVLHNKQARLIKLTEGLGLFGKETIRNQLWGEVPFILEFK
jgi:hypothetical protein